MSPAEREAMLKARYPEPPPPPTSWQGWRREEGKTFPGPWQKVPGAEAPTKGGCYEKTMALSELVGGEARWEYLLLPGGQKPD